MTRDFSKEKPISDEIFEAYKQQYAYDRAPLDARTDEAPENTPDWTREKISIDAGYERERLPLNLFLPKGVRRPLQTVLFFPSANVNFMASSKKLGDMAFIDYVIKSGRAVAYPIYKETYERAVHKGMPGTFEHIGVVVQESKEVRRSVDYLETRPEIDRSKLAYLGDSQGTAYGVIYTALENRFKALIFLDGGFFLCRCPAAVDQVNFAPRVKMPVLMVNGRYDFSFSVDNSQEPLFRMLGTPVADKRHVLLDTSHGVSQRPSELSKEVLAWLDKYLGRVN
jgi:predicted esterase